MSRTVSIFPLGGKKKEREHKHNLEELNLRQATTVSLLVIGA